MTPQNPALWTPLETSRLLLRRPVAGDLGAAVEIHTDPATNLHNPSAGSVSAESTAARLDVMLEHWASRGFGVWAVALRDSPEQLIGFSGLSHRVVAGRAALNLYYRYRPSAWGHGFATEGARFAFSQAAALLPGLPVVAYTTPSNTGSIRTALAAGLERRPELDVVHSTHTDLYLAAGW